MVMSTHSPSPSAMVQPFETEQQAEIHHLGDVVRVIVRDDPASIWSRPIDLPATFGEHPCEFHVRQAPRAAKPVVVEVNDPSGLPFSTYLTVEQARELAVKLLVTAGQVNR